MTDGKITSKTETEEAWNTLKECLNNSTYDEENDEYSEDDDARCLQSFLKTIFHEKTFDDNYSTSFQHRLIFACQYLLCINDMNADGVVTQAEYDFVYGRDFGREGEEDSDDSSLFFFWSNGENEMTKNTITTALNSLPETQKMEIINSQYYILKTIYDTGTLPEDGGDFIEDLFKIDTNNDMQLDIEELQAAATANSLDDDPDNDGDILPQAMMDLIDVNGDGTLSLSELIQFINSDDENPSDEDMERARKIAINIIEKYDQNNDDMINVQELIDLVNNSWFTDGTTVNETEINEVVGIYDGDGDEKLNQDEFTEFIADGVDI